MDLLKVRARTVEDLLDQAEPYFLDELDLRSQGSEEAVGEGSGRDGRQLGTLQEALAGVTWDQETLEEVARELAEEMEIGAGKLFQPLRLALTGSSASPGIFDVLVLLGRERSLERIERAVNILRSGKLPFRGTMKY